MAHPDLDQLLDQALKFAQSMLAKHGQFLPFGLSMTMDGEVSMDSAYTEREPSPQELINNLTTIYKGRAQAKEIRAAAICFDGRVVPPGKTEKSDAISLALEHMSGEAVNVCLPYQKNWFGRIRPGKLFASARDAAFFSLECGTST